MAWMNLFLLDVWITCTKALISAQFNQNRNYAASDKDKGRYKHEKIQSRNKFFLHAPTIMINNTKINVSFITEKVLLNKNGTLLEYDYSLLKKRAFWSKNPRTLAQWGSILSQPNIYSLIKQVPTFHDATTSFSIKKCWRTFAEVQFWWGLTTSRIWVVFLIGWKVA